MFLVCIIVVFFVVVLLTCCVVRLALSLGATREAFGKYSPNDFSVFFYIYIYIYCAAREDYLSITSNRLTVIGR